MCRTGTWTIDVLAPDGTSGGGEFLSSFLDPTAGTFEYFLCGSEMPGTWTVVGTGEYEGGDGLTRTWQMTPSTFQVRAAHSRTQLKKKPLGKGVYSLKVTVKDERPNGYYGTDYPTVKLQKRGGRRLAPSHRGLHLCVQRQGLGACVDEERRQGPSRHRRRIELRRLEVEAGDFEAVAVPGRAPRARRCAVCRAAASAEREAPAAGPSLSSRTPSVARPLATEPAGDLPTGLAPLLSRARGPGRFLVLFGPVPADRGIRTLAGHRTPSASDMRRAFCRS